MMPYFTTLSNDVDDRIIFKLIIITEDVDV
jgi:hypothetical protein